MVVSPHFLWGEVEALSSHSSSGNSARKLPDYIQQRSLQSSSESSTNKLPGYTQQKNCYSSADSSALKSPEPVQLSVDNDPAINEFDECGGTAALSYERFPI